MPQNFIETGLNHSRSAPGRSSSRVLGHSEFGYRFRSAVVCSSCPIRRIAGGQLDLGNTVPVDCNFPAVLCTSLRDAVRQ